MPKGSAKERLKNIRAEGAQASITELNYDESVRLADRQAREQGWVMVQDTAWEGYEDIPTWIMQGYTTMGAEIARQLEGETPTHLFLQAGVGSMAAAMAAFFASYYGSNCPKIIVVEPDEANCFYQTASAADGNLHVADGDLDTIMAGLACGEPCDIAWDILHATAHGFASMPDWVAAEGMRVLGYPHGDDSAIISGESGASGAGLAIEVLRNPLLSGLRELMGLGSDSRVLCISTEGATDRENYRRIVEEGAYPRP
jgi:diaminopropionate ammonia-lyase